MINDAEYLRRYVDEGAEDAFAELVRRNLGWVYHASLRRTGERHDVAREVSQQVFTALASNAASLRHHENLGGWLYVATRFASTRALRSEARRRARETDAQALAEQTNMRGAPNWDEVRLLLDEAIDRLPTFERDGLIQRFFQGLGFSEIGRSLGLSEDAARKRVDRALIKLRRHLQRKGITSTSAALAGLLSTDAAPAAAPVLQAAITTKALSAAATGLAGIGTPASAIALHAFRKAAMTFTQKILLGATVTATIGGVLYESSLIRAENLKILSLEKQRAVWVHRVGDAKLAQARLASAAAASSKAADPDITDPATEAQMQFVRTSIAKLKQKLAEDPSQRIPEMAYLKDEDWILVVQAFRKLETKEDFRKALGDLRNEAVSNFESGALQPAWEAYFRANGSNHPPSVQALAPYFDPPLPDPAVLARYSYVSPPASDPLSGPQFIGFDPARVIDPLNDDVNLVQMDGRGNPGSGSWGSVAIYQLHSASDHAFDAFKRDHPLHISYPKPEELAPYFEKPGDAQRYLEANRWSYR